jgi:hypothetical protein
MSAAGMSLVAAVGGDLWTSSDGGVTWVDRTPSGSAHDLFWGSVASDSTGTKLVALQTEDGFGQGDADVWTSADGGETWIHQLRIAQPVAPPCASVASDATGTHLVVAANGIWTSADSGATWTQQQAPKDAWGSVASDATGTHLVAVNNCSSGNPTDVWTSADSGVTWTNETAGTAAANQAWSGVATNANGSLLVGVVSGGDIWTK